MSAATAPYQFYDELDGATEDALRASIDRWGVLVPIAVDQFGNIIDGHHRKRISGEFGRECPVRRHVIADEDEARELARTLNEDRRHLPPEQRRPVVADLRGQGHSLRAIAGAVGTSLGTVQRDLEGVSGDTPHEVRGRDGKTYPSSQPSKRCSSCAEERPLTSFARDKTSSDGRNHTCRKCDQGRTRHHKKGPSQSEPSDPDRVPAWNDKSRAAVEYRENAIATMAGEGHSSSQIAAELGISEKGVKVIAKRVGVEIVADKHLGNVHRIDSTRIMEAAVISAENVTAGVELIDYEDLDPARLDEWVSSLDRAIKSLTTFKRQLVKELTQHG